MVYSRKLPQIKAFAKKLKPVGNAQTKKFQVQIFKLYTHFEQF